ncbi:hypothetical protein O6H91_19G037800 [Diphasiastrum complanatum]|uniref:Uncharacterized protein n=1 Tax=Diphasiastrum complanatum TaxID=34168 RepID=A0ACC2AUF7_DIPCM|nr:hypothetical protein O6H91_19G037800 [Diphasiastrum complanatum]
MLMYHVLSEYQTEESLYNVVRRSGKAIYSTLRLPHKLTAVEAEGTVQFGTGKGAATVYDPDIFADGRVSVQGINAVLIPLSSEGLSQERGLSGSAETTWAFNDGSFRCRHAIQKDHGLSTMAHFAADTQSRKFETSSTLLIGSSNE